ncbi:MAG: hypothetical protein HRT88_10765 [Lentisphaeraceae bacterium]|nr:hypothetical protein [Lentisphaeraceae bacterium]
MNELEVILGGGSEEELYLKGPGDVRFTVSGARFASKEVRMVLKNLPTGIKRFYFPHTGNIPILPACALALNPRAQISVFEIDAHDYHSMKRRLVGYSNIEFSLGTDMNGKKGRKQAVVFCISRNTDRLLCFDILERLNKELEDGTPIYILLAKNRQRDMIKKFN